MDESAPAEPEALSANVDAVTPAKPRPTDADDEGSNGGSDQRDPATAPKPRKGLFAKALENPIWTTLGALVGVVGLVLSSIEIYQALRTPPVDLEIAALRIDTQQSVRGTVSGDSTGTRAVKLTPIDLTLQNKGGQPSLITTVEAELVYFQQLSDCTGAHPAAESITTPYQLAIPMTGVEPAEKRLSSEIRFEVKPGTADRMVVTVGPLTQPAFATTPMVMTANIRLIHDGNQIMEVGTVSLVATADAAIAQIDALASSPSPEARACAKANLELLDQMFAIQATRSQLLDDLRSAFQQTSA